jgi:hypothetical protein
MTKQQITPDDMKAWYEEVKRYMRRDHEENIFFDGPLKIDNYIHALIKDHRKLKAEIKDMVKAVHILEEVTEQLVHPRLLREITIEDSGEFRGALMIKIAAKALMQTFGRR